MGGFTFALSDSIVLSDNLGSDRGFLLRDQIPFLDGLRLTSKEVAFALTYDVLNLDDSVALSLIVVLTANVSDTISLSDTFTSRIGYGYEFSDRIQLLDLMLSDVNQGFTLEFNDNFNFIDRLATLSTNTPLVADAIALGDAISQSRTFFYDGDTFSFTDSITVSLNSIFLNLTESVSDSLSFADSVLFSRAPNSFSVGDTFQFQDSIGVSLRSIDIAYLRRYLNDI